MIEMTSAPATPPDSTLDNAKPVTSPLPVMNREPAPDKNLEMVRNILFGEQARDLERKQATLERFIRVSINALAEDTQKKLDTINHEVSLLKDLLAEESKFRREDTAAARLRLDQNERQLEELGKRTQAAHHEVHERMNREVAQLEQRLGDWRKDVLEQLRQTAEQLRHEKADRKAVAAILNGMAKQLFDVDQGEGL